MTLPASSCMNCHHNGTPSQDQQRYGAGKASSWTLGTNTRFYCPRCLRIWITDTQEAEHLGRFLDKARLR